ncbi:membrane protein [Mycobacterium sp. ST-F2]|nr:membrane protein [Mycobacterium sp. ST-F2]
MVAGAAPRAQGSARAESERTGGSAEKRVRQPRQRAADLRTLPVGTAYAVFTGFGAVGAIAIGVLVHKDPLNIGRSVALSMIVGGIVLARLTNPE